MLDIMMFTSKVVVNDPRIE